MESNSESKKYSLFFGQFIASDRSSLNHGFLQNSNFNRNHRQNQSLSPMIPLQTSKENPGASKFLNSFRPQQSFLRNSATEMYASSSKAVNLLQSPMENVTGSKDLGNSVPGQYSLLQNPAKQLYAGSNVVNQMQTPAENLGCSQLLNNFAPKQGYKGSDSAYHFSSPSQLLSNKVTENLSAPNIPKELQSEQLLKRPIENPKEDDPPSQTTSQAIDEIFPAKDDYSLAFVFQEGMKHCAVDVNEREQTTRNLSKEENSTGGLLMVELSSEATNQRDKRSLKIIDLLKQNLPNCPSQRRKEGDGQPKRKLQVASPGTPGYKENNKATPSLLATALVSRTDEKCSERSHTPLPSSVSPPSVTRGTGGPIRSRARTFPVKLYGETSHGSSSNRRFNWNMRYGGISSATPLYHRASRLSRSSSALGSSSNWQTIPSGYNPESESQKWQNLSGSGNVEGNMVNSRLIDAPETFDGGECQKPKQVDHHAIESQGTKIDTSNAASLELGEKEFKTMVNWPEHHLMGTDRFGFDV